MSSIANKKTFYFETIKYILDGSQLLEAVQNNSYSAPVLKIIRKRNAYDNETFFKDFNYRFNIFVEQAFSKWQTPSQNIFKDGL